MARGRARNAGSASRNNYPNTNTLSFLRAMQRVRLVCANLEILSTRARRCASQVKRFENKRHAKPHSGANAKLYVKRLQDAGQMLLNPVSIQQHQQPYDQQEQQVQYDISRVKVGDGDYNDDGQANATQAAKSLAQASKSTAPLAANAGMTSNFYKELVYVTNFLRTRSPKSLSMRKSRIAQVPTTLSTTALDNIMKPQPTNQASGRRSADESDQRGKKRRKGSSSNVTAEVGPKRIGRNNSGKHHPFRSSPPTSPTAIGAPMATSSPALQTTTTERKGHINQSLLNSTSTANALLLANETTHSTPIIQEEQQQKPVRHRSQQDRNVLPLPSSTVSRPNLQANKLKDVLFPYDLTQAVKQLKRKIMLATNPNEPDKINLSEDEIRAELHKLNWIKYQEETRAQRLGVRESTGYIDRVHFALCDTRCNRIPVDIGGQPSKIWRINNPSARLPPSIFVSNRGDGDGMMDFDQQQQSESTPATATQPTASSTSNAAKGNRKRHTPSPTTLYEQYAQERIDRLSERNEQNSAWLQQENTTTTTIPLHFINATLPPPQATQIGLDDSVRYMPNERTLAPAMLQLRLPGFDAHTLKTLAASGGRNILPPHSFNPQRTALMQRRMRDKLDLLYLKKLQNLTRRANNSNNKNPLASHTTEAALSFSNVNLSALLSMAPHLKIICPRCKRQKLNTLPKALLRQQDGATRNLLIRLNLVCPFRNCDGEPRQSPTIPREKAAARAQPVQENQADTKSSSRIGAGNSPRAAGLSGSEKPRFVISKEIDDKFVRNSRNRFARVARHSNFSKKEKFTANRKLTKNGSGVTGKDVALS